LMNRKKHIFFRTKQDMICEEECQRTFWGCRPP
jgi:hypothetical protein